MLGSYFTLHEGYVVCMNVYGECLCSKSKQFINCASSIINSQSLEPVLFIYVSPKVLLYMMNSPQIFIVSMYALIVALRHLLTCFSYNFSKQGGHYVDFTDILLILLKVPIFINVPYTRSVFLKINSSNSQRDFFCKGLNKLHTEQPLPEV